MLRKSQKPRMQKKQVKSRVQKKPKSRKMLKKELSNKLKNKLQKPRTIKDQRKVANNYDGYTFIQQKQLQQTNLKFNLLFSFPLPYLVFVWFLIYFKIIKTLELLLVNLFTYFIYPICIFFTYNSRLRIEKHMLIQNIEAEENNSGILFNMFENEKYQNLLIKSISKQLDQFFEGGLHKGCVTQVYGESGSGKSQLAMFYALGAISRNIPCCFLSTEKQLSWNRFTGIAYSLMNQAEFEEYQKKFLYKKTSDFHQGYIFIEDSMKKIKQNGKGGLLVIDSIHGFIMNCIQQNNIQNDLFQKSRKQAQIVNRLRWLAKMSGSAVLLINHAADALDKVRRASSGRAIVPSLGSSWQLNIDENIYLTRKKQIRQLSVIFSPKISTNKKKRFRIQNQGFTWISQDGVQYIE